MKKQTEETPDLAQPDGNFKEKEVDFDVSEALLRSKIDILDGISLIKSKIGCVLFEEGNEKLGEVLDLSSSIVNLSESYKNLCMFVEEDQEDDENSDSGVKIDISKIKKKGK